jgi:hypothetical protein
MRLLIIRIQLDGAPEFPFAIPGIERTVEECKSYEL